MLRRAGALAAVVVAAYGASRLVARLFENSVSVTVNETVQLQSETTDSFASLNIEVEGRINVTTNLLDRCEFLMKINSRAAGGAGGLSGSYSGASSPTAGRSSSGVAPRVALGNVVLNDMVDAEMMAGTGHMRFMPPCVGVTPLLRYAAPVADSFVQPVTIRNCVVQPSSVPGTMRLTFEFVVTLPILEASVSFIFPKGSHLVNVDTQGLGSWHLIGPHAPTEMVWTVPCISGGGSAVVAARATHTGPLHSGSPGSGGSSGGGGSEFLDATATMSAPQAAAAAAAAVLGAHLTAVSVEIVYAGTSGGAAAEDGIDGDRARRGATKRERKRAAQEQRDAVAPAVCLAYSTNCAASGLFLKKLQTLSSRPNASWWGGGLLPEEAPAPTSPAASDVTPGESPTTAAAAAAPPPLLSRRKILKRVKYITRYVQHISPELAL